MTLDLTKLRQTKKGKDLIVVTRKDLSDLYSHNARGNSVYKCPFCKERGHEGQGAKLFMNEIKGSGWCFVCNLVVVYEESYDIFVEAKNYKTVFNKAPEKKSFDIMSWTVPATESAVALKYISTRPFQYTPGIIERYNIRFAEVDSVPVLVMPNFIKDGQTDFFQYKVLMEDHPYSKYMTMGSPPLMWLALNSKESKDIILVEGLFDAIAITGVPLLGTTLSDEQGNQLRAFCLKHAEIKRIIIALDGSVSHRDKRSLSEYVKSISNEIPVFVAYLPGTMDPEEAAAAGELSNVFENELEAVA